MLISLLSFQPQQRQGHEHRLGVAESVYLFRHPHRLTPPYIWKTRDMGCGCKTLSTTRQIARPYAPVATVFLLTSIIEFIVPRSPSFSICLLEKGSEGSTCRISFKVKLSGRLKSIEWLGAPPREGNKKLRCSCRLHRPHRKHRTRTPH